MATNRCAAPDCSRFVRRDATWCARHDPVAVWRPEDAEHSNRRVDAARELATEFQRRMERGEYRELLGDDMNAVIKQAADETGLTDEIGILRVVLAKLLIEETDSNALASAVARVAAVAVQAVRTQRAIDGGPADSLLQAVNTILIELEQSGEG